MAVPRARACEPDPRIAGLFRALATTAEPQAGTWQRRGHSSRRLHHRSARALARAARAPARAATRAHMLAAMKVRGLSVYDLRRRTRPRDADVGREVGARHKGTAAATCAPRCSA